MSRKSVSVRVMKKVIRDLGDVFTTKDVSEDERMLKAHRRLVKHSHYHAFVGGALSDHRSKLKIKEIQKATRRGSRWQKVGFLSKISSTTSPPKISSTSIPPKITPVSIPPKKVEPQSEPPKIVIIFEEKAKPPPNPAPTSPVTLLCPTCGGGLLKTEITDYYQCPYCGNEHIIGT